MSSNQEIIDTSIDEEADSDSELNSDYDMDYDPDYYSDQENEYDLIRVHLNRNITTPFELSNEQSRNNTTRCTVNNSEFCSITISDSSSDDDIGNEHINVPVTMKTSSMANGKPQWCNSNYENIYCDGSQNYKTLPMQNINDYHQGEKPYICGFCQRRYVFKKDLDVHQLREHGIDSDSEEVEVEEVEDSPCTNQTVYLPDQVAYENNIEIKDEPLNIKPELVIVTTLKEQDKSDDNKSGPISQNSFVHKPNIFCKCAICYKRDLCTQNGGVPYQHVDKPFECNVCHKRYTQKSYLTTHLRLHNGIKPFECPICHKKYSQKSNLKSHMRTHNDKRAYGCEICYKQFKYMSTLNTHQRVHTCDKLYKCEICSEELNSKCDLAHHLRVHADVKPFVCQICNKWYSTLNYLKTHIEEHIGKRPYQCSCCFKTFTFRCRLLQHMCSHYREKPYRCDLCFAHYSIKKQLIKHTRVHSKEKPHLCVICQNLFSDFHNYFSHTLTH